MIPQELPELSETELRELWKKGLVEIGVKGDPGEPGVPLDISKTEEERLLKMLNQTGEH